jgi:hypothetical protein
MKTGSKKSKERSGKIRKEPEETRKEQKTLNIRKRGGRRKMMGKSKGEKNEFERRMV